MVTEPFMPVTTIFARAVRPGHEMRYEDWLAGISRASSGFAGNHGTTILRPADSRKEYVAITQFDTQHDLDKWLESPERSNWLAKLESIDICSQDVISLAGMERWFSLPGTSTDHMPSRHKTATLILLGLYPLVLVLDVILSPLLAGLPGPLQVLISLMVSVAMMVWIVLPGLTRLFSGWLHPKPKPSESSGSAN
jgi:antibiotic biosynthesis monooxygenase (ABM) superfamily enzyme